MFSCKPSKCDWLSHILCEPGRAKWTGAWCSAGSSILQLRARLLSCHLARPHRRQTRSPPHPSASSSAVPSHPSRHRVGGFLGSVDAWHQGPKKDFSTVGNSTEAPQRRITSMFLSRLCHQGFITTIFSLAEQNRRGDWSSRVVGTCYLNTSKTGLTVWGNYCFTVFRRGKAAALFSLFFMLVFQTVILFSWGFYFFRPHIKWRRVEWELLVLFGLVYRYYGGVHFVLQCAPPTFFQPYFSLYICFCRLSASPIWRQRLNKTGKITRFFYQVLSAAQRWPTWRSFCVPSHAILTLACQKIIRGLKAPLSWDNVCITYVPERGFHCVFVLFCATRPHIFTSVRSIAQSLLETLLTDNFIFSWPYFLFFWVYQVDAPEVTKSGTWKCDGIISKMAL